MTEILFRRAEAADLSRIVALFADDDLGHGREDPREPLDPGYLAALAAIEADPNQLQAVAVAEGEVVGVLQISFIPGLTRKGAWRGQIEGVRIAASHRGAGLGRRMLLWAVERCRERGCVLVQLTSDRSRADAHRFYESLGFVGSHLGYKLDL